MKTTSPARCIPADRRNRSAILSLGLAAFLGGASSSFATGKISPGADADIDASLLGGAMKVFLPANYDAAEKWPVIFFYPGQDAAPQTATIRKFADDRDFIIVGLPYPDAGPAPSSRAAPPRYIDRLRGDFAKARAWICTNASIDTNRLFMGGVSKGGWTTSLVGEPEMAGLRGLIILLAGRGYPTSEAPAGNCHGKVIYIGDGENDTNMRPARTASEFFLRYRADVTLEEFPGTGHAMPQDAPRLRTWLHVFGPLWKLRTNDMPEIGLWFTNSLAAMTAEQDSGGKFRKLLDILRDPRFPLCAHNEVTLADTLTEATAQLSPAHEEWLAERAYRGLIWRESKISTLADMRAVRDGFLNVSTNFPHTRFGKLAAEDFKMVDDAYQKSLNASRTANARLTNNTQRVTLPPTRSDRPAGPIIEGNKIKFTR